METLTRSSSLVCDLRDVLRSRLVPELRYILWTRISVSIWTVLKITKMMMILSRTKLLSKKSLLL